jgi:hypothetical protein
MVRFNQTRPLLQLEVELVLSWLLLAMAALVGGGGGGIVLVDDQNQTTDGVFLGRLWVGLGGGGCVLRDGPVLRGSAGSHPFPNGLFQLQILLLLCPSPLLCRFVFAFTLLAEQSVLVWPQPTMLQHHSCGYRDLPWSACSHHQHQHQRVLTCHIICFFFHPRSRLTCSLSLPIRHLCFLSCTR